MICWVQTMSSEKRPLIWRIDIWVGLVLWSVCLRPTARRACVSGETVADRRSCLKSSVGNISELRRSTQTARPSTLDSAFTNSQTMVSVTVWPVRALGRNAPLIHLLISALYIYCLLVNLASPTYFIFSLLIFPYLSTSLLTFSFENRPASFPGWRSQEATIPGFKLFKVILHYSVFVFLIHGYFVL